MRMSANESGKMFHRLITTMLCLAMLLVIAAPAMAQTSVTQGYDESGVIGEIDENPGPDNPGQDDEPNGTVVPAGDDDTPTPPTTRETGDAPVSAGQLPFTGFEAGLIAMVGLALLGTGVVLRRTQRSAS